MSVKPIIEKTLASIETALRKKGFNIIILKSEQKLRKFIYDTIPDNCIVGLGNSLSNSALKIRDILLEKGNKVYLAWNGGSFNRSIDTFEELPQPDFFLTSTVAPEQTITDLNIELPNLSVSTNFPKHIIAFSSVGNKSESLSKEEYNMVSVNKKPVSANITIAILPFLMAS